MTSPSADALFEAMKPPPPRRLGWWLLAWPGFQAQFDRLVETVERLREKEPDGYRVHPQAKLLAAIVRIVTHDVPRDPGHSDFRQGGTLGAAYTAWFRAKFYTRFRLLFRFDSQRKAIVFAWVNVEGGLRKEGDRNDPYYVFRRMLERGRPPTSFDDLLANPEEWSSHPDRT
jgi:toxin YhaV